MTEPSFYSQNNVPVDFKTIYSTKCDTEDIKHDEKQKSRVMVNVCSNDISPTDREIVHRLARGLGHGKCSFNAMQYTFNSIWDQSVPMKRRIGHPTTQKRIVRYKVDRAFMKGEEFPKFEHGASLGAMVDAIMDWEEKDKHRAAEGLAMLKTQM
ncbi:MAG: hypothetical protein ACTSUE_17315 [Promethearchaeota archaeon]